MPTPDNGIPGWDRARLEQGLRACDSRALVAFYSHFRPLLGERAALFGIPAAERADAIETFVGDLLLRLCSANELPRSLHAYVLVSFKRFAIRLKRADTLTRDSLDDFESVVPHSNTIISEAAPQTSNESLARFTAALLADLSSDERLILGAAAEEMPVREIAALLDVNYNAANTRLCRLRSKLRATASMIVSRMNPGDRQVVDRFLRRAGSGQDAERADAEARESRNQKQRRSNNG